MGQIISLADVEHQRPQILASTKISEQLQQVLDVRMREFEAYLGRQYADELLLFWHEAARVSVIQDPAALGEACASLFEKFVANGAQAQGALLLLFLSPFAYHLWHH